jgi:hypothetical protein
MHWGIKDTGSKTILDATVNIELKEDIKIGKRGRHL